MSIVSAKSRLLLKLRKSSFSDANHRSPQCLHYSGRIVPMPPAPALVSPRHWRQFTASNICSVGFQQREPGVRVPTPWALALNSMPPNTPDAFAWSCTSFRCQSVSWSGTVLFQSHLTFPPKKQVATTHPRLRPPSPRQRMLHSRHHRCKLASGD